MDSGPPSSFYPGKKDGRVLYLSFQLRALMFLWLPRMEVVISSNLISSEGRWKELFHVIHKVPAGDSHYFRAKHLQLIDKNPDSSIVWFWKAVNAGDRVDGALKGMAVVITQQDRAEVAIEAIKSFGHLCSKQARESLDNLLINLYKIELLKQKLRMIYHGEAFNGKITKTARPMARDSKSLSSKKLSVSWEICVGRTLQNNFATAAAVYHKAQMIKPDANKACNLRICLMRQGDFDNARCVILDIVNYRFTSCEERKASNRAMELLCEIKSLRSSSLIVVYLRLEKKNIET